MIRWDSGIDYAPRSKPTSPSWWMKSVRQRRASGPTMPGGTGCAVTQAVARRRTTRSRIMIAAAAAIVAEPVAKVPPRTTPGLEPSSTGSPRQGGQVSAPSVASRGKITRDEPLALRSSWPRSRARILHDLAKWGELRKVTRTQSRNLGCISTAASSSLFSTSSCRDAANLAQ